MGLPAFPSHQAGLRRETFLRLKKIPSCISTANRLRRMSDARSEILARIRHASNCLPEAKDKLAQSLLGAEPCAKLPHPELATVFLTNVV